MKNRMLRARIAERLRSKLTRIVILTGARQTGKTTLALHVAAEAQKKDGIVAFIDAEHGLDPKYARKLGVNTAELLISQPDTGEQALEIAETLVRSGAVDVIIIDSVAALVPKMKLTGIWAMRPWDSRPD